MAVNPRGYQELAIRGTSGSRTESLYHTAFLREYHMFANLHEVIIKTYLASCKFKEFSKQALKHHNNSCHVVRQGSVISLSTKDTGHKW